MISKLIQIDLKCWIRIRIQLSRIHNTEKFKVIKDANVLYVVARNKSLFERLGIQFYLLILVNFLAPGSGSAFPFPFRIQESQINADPDPQQ
jgi:hypothetical protein